MNQPQLQAALIHHRTPARAVNRHTLRTLCRGLGLPLIEIVDQPDLDVGQPSIADRFWVVGRHLLRSAADAWFQFSTRRYSLAASLRRYIAESCRLLRAFACSTPNEWAFAYRVCLVEDVLVQKHLAAWRAALQANAQWLLVLEDDAEVLPQTGNRIKVFLGNQLMMLEFDGRMYCDFAGGYAPHLVLPRNAEWNPKLGYWNLPYIRTNTICSYLISKQLSKDILSIVDRLPLLKQLPADHLINLASRLTQPKNVSSLCLHWQAPFFRHGSFQDGLASTVSGVR